MKTIYHSRSSGVLAHVTSLPSTFGIGDMGPGTVSFLDFLHHAEQSIWQILPLGPTDPAFSNSPYMSVSAFAGNPLLISPDLLLEEDLLGKNDIEDAYTGSPYSVDFKKVIQSKHILLKKAYSHFKPHRSLKFQEFVKDSYWLADYCLFMALKKNYPTKPWYKWDKNIVSRKPDTLAEIKSTLQASINYYEFEQFVFFQQWHNVRTAAHDRNIEIFGDIPIYVSLDSADVWAHQEIFELHPETCKPTHVSGVPPDYFSKTGQKWGNPLYSWGTKNKQTQSLLIDWWSKRFEHIFKQVDIARIDHFRGFESYWSVPAHHKTALRGEWKKGPGASFFLEIFAKLGNLNIVAEDLGEITDEVIALRDELGFPGMRILQFAFDGDPKNSYLPYNFETSNTFVYTGTHDNDTTVGWYLDQQINDKLRSVIKKMANRDIHDDHGIHKDLIFLAMSSIATSAILPLQDVLGFGSDCRMNTPGTVDGNWLWRCSEEFLTDDAANWLKDLTLRFGRRRKRSPISSDKV